MFYTPVQYTCNLRCSIRVFLYGVMQGLLVNLRYLFSFSEALVSRGTYAQSSTLVFQTVQLMLQEHFPGQSSSLTTNFDSHHSSFTRLTVNSLFIESNWRISTGGKSNVTQCISEGLTVSLATIFSESVTSDSMHPRRSGQSACQYFANVHSIPRIPSVMVNLFPDPA